MTKLLHIDTATDTGTVAIGIDGVVAAYRTNEEARNHASVINNMINDLLADAEISMEELSAIAVCAGPGSYTGLRIGMATAKGLCYALDKPLILADRLSLLAYRAYRQQKNAAQYVSLLTARDKEYFISVYDNNFVCTVQPQHIMENQLGSLVEKIENSYLITDAPTGVNDSLNIINLSIDNDTKTELSSWAFFAFEQYKCNKIVNLSVAEPFYLKQVYTHK